MTHRFSKMHLRTSVYPDHALGGAYLPLPGDRIAEVLHLATEAPGERFLQSKLIQSCRKLCFMWYAADQAILAEREFYTQTIPEAPALYGEHRILVEYHLEAMILFARSAMDIAAGLFGWTLPNPFPRGRFDSFNKLVKRMLEEPNRISLASYFETLREDGLSWLSTVSGTERGRSLRDKIAHQTEFPIEYLELDVGSEKESAVVLLGQSAIPLSAFVEQTRRGVVDGYLALEEACVGHLKSAA